MKITLMVASVVDHKAVGPGIQKGIRANEEQMIFANYPINVLAENAGRWTAERWQSITTTPRRGRLTIASYARTVTLSFMRGWPCQQGKGRGARYLYDYGQRGCSSKFYVGLLPIASFG